MKTNKFISLALVLSTLGCDVVNGGNSPAPAEATTPSVSKVVEAPPGASLPRLTPVTLGDAVIDPFFDPALGAWSKWTIASDKDPVKVTELWCMVAMTWTASAAGNGPTLERVYPAPGVTLGPYSELVLSAGFPKGTTITMLAETDMGRASREFVCDAGDTSQHVLPLPAGSTHLLRVEISPGAAAPGPVTGNLLWLGVRDPRQFAAEMAQWQLFSAQPMDVFLREEPEPADASPLYNILCPADAFKEQKEKTAASGAAALPELRSQVTLLPHLGGANQNLFGRKEIRRDLLAKTFSTPGGKSMGLVRAAQQAALAGDKQALREVAGAAVQIALIPHWDADFITQFPDSSWDQRCFAQAAAAHAVAVAFDLAGSWLTPAGRDLILRRLAEEGLGNINYNVWRYPYIFTCNQLAAFSQGRLAAYSVLEKQKTWGHVRPYTDLAFDELNESLAKILLPDGGFAEGPAYLSYTLNHGLQALALYGNARNKPLRDLLPPLLSKVDDYLEAMRSTVFPPGTILVCDAQGGPFAGFSVANLNVMAKIRPGGAAARMLASMTEEHRGRMDLWALPAADLAGVNPQHYAAFVHMPDAGVASSARKVGDLWGKLFIIGGPAKAGHNHEDRGSFALEFAGETFAADPGGLIYADAKSQAMKNAQHHNMLVPVSSASARPAPQNPASVAVIPEAQGDATTFNASLNPGVLWPDYFKQWKRSFASPTPDQITITDDYELLKGEGVEFLWHTPLPVTQEGDKVVITGARGRAIITPPSGAKIEITPPRQLGTRELATIRFRNAQTSGHLETQVRLEAKASAPPTSN